MAFVRILTKNRFFASKVKSMEKIRTCKKCNEEKDLKTEFYRGETGHYRHVCKKCISRRNYLNKKRKIESGDVEFIEKSREYMREYVRDNKDYFDMKREEFAARNPNYQKEYQERRKNESYKPKRKGTLLND